MNQTGTNCFSIEFARIRILKDHPYTQHYFKLRIADRPPGRITVDQSQLELKPSKSQLELKPSKTLSLVGGDIDIVGGQRVISTPYYSYSTPTFIGGVGSQINL